MVMICKIGESQLIANLIKSLSVNIYNEGGIVRRFTNLGDRIPSKRFRAKDNSDNFVVRYMAVEFDANPETMLLAKTIASEHSETMDITVHKLKEKDYYKTMMNKVITNNC